MKEMMSLIGLAAGRFRRPFPKLRPQDVAEVKVDT
jgi:hypothetical protein